MSPGGQKHPQLKTNDIEQSTHMLIYKHDAFNLLIHSRTSLNVLRSVSLGDFIAVWMLSSALIPWWSSLLHTSVSGMPPLDAWPLTDWTSCGAWLYFFKFLWIGNKYTEYKIKRAEEYIVKGKSLSCSLLPASFSLEERHSYTYTAKGE